MTSRQKTVIISFRRYLIIREALSSSLRRVLMQLFFNVGDRVGREEGVIELNRRRLIAREAKRG